MSYYHFNRKQKKDILKAAKSCKKQKKDILKAAEYYLQNKESVKPKSKNRYNTCQKKKEKRLKSIKEKVIRNWFGTKKKHYKKVLFLLSVRMSKKKIKFDNIKVNKKEFHKSFKRSSNSSIWQIQE